MSHPDESCSCPSPHPVTLYSPHLNTPISSRDPDPLSNRGQQGFTARCSGPLKPQGAKTVHHSRSILDCEGSFQPLFPSKLFGKTPFYFLHPFTGREGDLRLIVCVSALLPLHFPSFPLRLNPYAIPLSLHLSSLSFLMLLVPVPSILLLPTTWFSSRVS